MGKSAKPKPVDIGDFAICQNGDLGLVLWYKVCVDKRTNKKYILYYGLNLSSGLIGINWQSRNPKRVTKAYVRKIFSPRVIMDKR